MTYFGAQLFGQLMAASPNLLVYLVAFICALALLGRCPRAATLAAIGCAILFLNVLQGAFSSTYFINLRASGAISTKQFGVVLTVSGLVRGLFAVAGFVLVFAAVFVGRAKPPAPPPLPPPLPLPPQV